MELHSSSPVIHVLVDLPRFQGHNLEYACLSIEEQPRSEQPRSGGKSLFTLLVPSCASISSEIPHLFAEVRLEIVVVIVELGELDGITGRVAPGCKEACKHEERGDVAAKHVALMWCRIWKGTVFLLDDFYQSGLELAPARKLLGVMGSWCARYPCVERRHRSPGSPTTKENLPMVWVLKRFHLQATVKFSRKFHHLAEAVQNSRCPHARPVSGAASLLLVCSGVSDPLAS